MTDYIKRDAVIDYLASNNMPWRDWVKDIPSADVRENITAQKVIGGGEHDGATCWFECGNCQTMVDINDKYCSECGARFKK